MSVGTAESMLLGGAEAGNSAHSRTSTNTHASHRHTAHLEMLAHTEANLNLRLRALPRLQPL